jgi:hypothetical protein
MAERLNTYVDFHGDFPYRPGWTEDSRIELPGKELAELLADGLRHRGVDVSRVDALDYGHFLRCRSGGRSYTVEVTVDDAYKMERWTAQCYPDDDEGILSGLFRRPDHAGLAAVLNAIHLTLTGSGSIRDVRWFPSYEPPQYLDDRKADPWPFPPKKTSEASDFGLCDRDVNGVV